MRSPACFLKRCLAVAVVLLSSMLPASAQSARTRVWHGTQLVEPPVDTLTVEQAPMPRVVATAPPEPERLPPVQAQPQVGIEVLQALLAELSNARRIDRLEVTTNGIQRELDRQSIRQAANAEVAPARLPESLNRPEPPAVKVDVERADTQPSWTNLILSQLAAIVGAIVVVCVLFFGLHVLLVRRGGGMGSLFKIELIGTHAPASADHLPVAEVIPPDPLPEPWGEVTPNFDIGPTYEEEKQLREQAERNKEQALLMHIFEENQKVQQEISSLPPDAELELAAIDPETQTAAAN